ncbi:MAG: capsule assembly Wzi family protein [Bacteroides sp.]
MFRKYIVGLIILFPVGVQAQIEKGFSYTLEANATVTGNGDHAPFWLTANRHGLSSVRQNSAYLSAGIFRQLEQEKKFSYAFGLELAALTHFTSSHVVQQAYADVRYRCWQLSVGSKERGSELKNDALSIGGMTFSPNARPIPQVRLSIPEYIPFPGTHGWLHLRGHIAYGIFTDDRFQKDFTQERSKYTRHVLYHSKAAFLKLEHPNTPVTLEAGIEMAAQFGGDCCYPDGTVLTTPKGIGDFIRIFFPMRGSSDASASDQKNILGNHLGSYHFSAGYRFPEWKVRGYYEHYFDDGSGMMMKYGMWKDCLAGLEVTLPPNPVATSVVAEFLYTKHQSGAFHWYATPDVDESYTGADNYYNNGQFVGWEHWGQGVGNPLLIAPLYNTDGGLNFNSTRVKAFHLGISGKPLKEIEYRLLMSFAQHWGTYGSPYPEIKSNKNALLELSYLPAKSKGWQFTLAVAVDGGDLIGKSQGAMFSIRKTGWLGGKKQ